MKDLFGNQIVAPQGEDRKKADRIAVHQYKQLISIYGKKDGKDVRRVHSLNAIVLGQNHFTNAQKQNNHTLRLPTGIVCGPLAGYLNNHKSKPC